MVDGMRMELLVHHYDQKMCTRRRCSFQLWVPLRYLLDKVVSILPI